ncbi:hypothetical protein [[Kitasatospora] papulosa]|uniref:hypothetical protein n=1 Tax=[Kitasatospora] papulosa TaxID=1464011 RepID=UPI0036A186E2
MRAALGITSPLRKADDTELDWVVVRENSEGEYAGLGSRNLSGRGPGGEVARTPVGGLGSVIRGRRLREIVTLV